MLIQQFWQFSDRILDKGNLGSFGSQQRVWSVMVESHGGRATLVPEAGMQGEGMVVFCLLFPIPRHVLQHLGQRYLSSFSHKFLSQTHPKECFHAVLNQLTVNELTIIACKTLSVWRMVVSLQVYLMLGRQSRKIELHRVDKYYYMMCVCGIFFF